MRTALGPAARWLSPSFRITSAVVAVCAVLAFIPVVQVLLELIVHPATPSELVDRRGGQDATLVAVEGLALLIPVPADPPPEAEPAGSNPYHWYFLRDSTQDSRIALLRSPMRADALRTRTIVARLTDDPRAVEGALAAIAARGGVDPSVPVSSRLFAEVTAPVDGVRDLAAITDAATLSVGDLVRVRVHIEGGVASCISRGDCQARRLAAGIGSWDNLAADPAGAGWAVVRTTYPPSVAPFHGVGQLTRDRDVIARFLAERGVRSVLGWGRKLRTALVDHDPSLPVDHLWLGPIVLVVGAGMLLAGRRIEYPAFRATRRVGVVHLVASSAMIHGRATGRITPPTASPHELEDRPTTLRTGRGGGTELTMELARGRLEVTIPRLFGGLGTIDVGDLVMVSRTVPALKVDWYGSNLLLTFADRDARDAAAALIRGS